MPLARAELTPVMATLLSVDEDLAFFGDVDAPSTLISVDLARAVFAQQRVDLAGF